MVSATKLAFGLKAGATFHDIGTRSLDTIDEDAPFFSQNINETTFNVGEGFYFYQPNKYYISTSMSKITAKAAFKLDNLVQVMNKYPDLVIYATSYTDIRASNEYNDAISDRRAKTTVQYIVSKGIDPI